MTPDEQLLRGQLAYRDDHLPLLDAAIIVRKAVLQRRRRRVVLVAVPAVLVMAVTGVVVAVSPSGGVPASPAVTPSPTMAPTSQPTESSELDARRACDAVLDVRLPYGTDRWRESVRVEADRSYVVNVWTEVEPDQPQEGVPDYVCSIGPDLAVRSIRPDPGPPGPVGADGRAAGSVAASQVVQFVKDGETTTDGVFSPSTVRVQLDAADNVFRDAGLVFPLVPLTASCLESASVDLDVRSVSGAEAQLSVYPALAYNSLPAGRMPTEPDAASRLLAARPRGVTTRPIHPGAVRIDVTDLYRRWLEGYFPDNGATLPSGRLFTVILRPPALTQEVWDVVISGTGDRAPTLTWRGRPGCR